MSLPSKTIQISFFELDHNLDTSTIVIDDDEEYDALCKFVKTYISSDCRALTINDEVIFNSYNEIESFQVEILQRILREQIIKNTHQNLLSLLYQCKTNKYTGEIVRKEGVIRIYMMEEPHIQIIEIHFDPERMVYFLMAFNGKFK